VKILSRLEIDGIVRQVEADAHGVALLSLRDPAPAERAMIDAFGEVAPSISRLSIAELERRVLGSIRKRGRPRLFWRPALALRSVVATTEAALPWEPVAVDEGLHIRLVDQVEERQHDQPPGRRRRLLVIAALASALLGGLAVVQSARLGALAAAAPTISDLRPAPGASMVPVNGEFHVSFGRRPSGAPTLRIVPAESVIQSSKWDGATLIVNYAGLRRTAHYQLVLLATYRSGLKDTGRFEHRWSFTVEGYPTLVAVSPFAEATVVPRVGELSVDFSQRPAFEPQLTISPAGTVQPGAWRGTSWIVKYSGLAPLTRYLVDVTLDQGAAGGNIRRRWGFITEPGPPPPGLAVIWYSTSGPWGDASVPQRLVAVDWTGNLAGTIYQTPPVGQAPDGSILIGLEGVYLDRGGRVIATTSPYRDALVVADDSRNVCALRGADGRAGAAVGQHQWINAGPVGGPLRQRGSVGVVGTNSQPTLIVCSLSSDRAVLADIGPSGTTGVRVIVLSTGRVIFRHVFQGGPIGVVSSHDARYVAESVPAYDSENRPTGGITLVRRTADGTIVARVADRRVVAFSWDGLRVVTAPFSGGIGLNEIHVLEWRDGKILWRLPGPPGTDGNEAFVALAQPNGADVVIGVGEPQSSGVVDGLWLVHPDGTATSIVSEAVYPAFSG
jgi:hypothetical protein